MYQEAVAQLTGKNLIKAKFENFIGGQWVAPVKGQYFDNLSPISGQVLCKVPRSTAEDIELALDAAHKAKDAWGRTPAAQRSHVLLKIADRIENNLANSGPGRNPRQRQADPRNHLCRRAAAGRPLPLLRRRASRPGRLDFGSRPRHHRLSLP